MESNRDMESLFDVLTSVKDCKGNHPVFTFLMNLANPDFKRIVDSDFDQYFYETFDQTLKRYPLSDNVIKLYHQGINQKVIDPQFHGREHVQISAWMKCLKSRDNLVRFSFANEFFHLPAGPYMEPVPGDFAEAFNFGDANEIKLQEEVIQSGIEIHKKLWDVKPIYFTAPSMIYNSALEKSLTQEGIKIMDVPLMRNEPLGGGKSRRRLQYFGQRTKSNGFYVNRNAVFETNLQNVSIDSCLKQISFAFSCKKPALISNHRASFVGGIIETNRTNGLKQLKQLLNSITKHWPDVEFINTRELLNILSTSNN